MVIKLPRLPTNWLTQPGLFQRYWDSAMKQIEDILNEILALPEIQAAIDAANAAAAAAQAAADNANASTDAQGSETSLNNSYINGFTPPLISADAAGNVTVANHSRVYGNSTLNPTVSVTGGIIASGAVSPDVVRIYYLDPTRAGGAVSYLFTVDPTTPVAQSGTAHSVGAVSIPAVGTNDGNGVKPPGYVEA